MKKTPGSYDRTVGSILLDLAAKPTRVESRKLGFPTGACYTHPETPGHVRRIADMEVTLHGEINGIPVADTYRICNGCYAEAVLSRLRSGIN